LYKQASRFAFVENYCEALAIVIDRNRAAASNPSVMTVWSSIEKQRKSKQFTNICREQVLVNCRSIFQYFQNILFSRTEK
jgi:hypothetical protein